MREFGWGGAIHLCESVVPRTQLSEGMRLAVREGCRGAAAWAGQVLTGAREVSQEGEGACSRPGEGSGGRLLAHSPAHPPGHTASYDWEVAET